MGAKLSVWAGAPLERALDGYDENRSARLNTLAERYLAIVEGDCPALTIQEWEILQQATISSAISYDLTTALGAWADVEDAAPDLAERHRAPALALAARVRDMRAGQRVALAEILERLRRTRARTALSEALRVAGARVASGGEPVAPDIVDELHKHDHAAIGQRFDARTRKRP